MKTLIVFYSKTGNTRKVAEKVSASLENCYRDEIIYDEKAKTVKASLNPTDYDNIILMCPIWAFTLPEPMTLYLKQYKTGIKKYRLAVTCGMFGLRGCVSKCVKILGTKPEIAVKIKANLIKDNTYNIDEIIK